jgi:3-hydroxyisobutyrate dehydrogenase
MNAVNEFAMSSTNQVGIVGVGNMGSGMAQRLLSLGWQVGVCDIDRAKTHVLERNGAVAHENPASLTSKFVAVIVCVVDAVQTAQVVSGAAGLLDGARAGGACRTVLLCPTIAPQDTERFSALLGGHGIACIDAPMSGGPARALDGSMSLMVACPAPLFAQQAGLLAALSSKVFHVSKRVGDGARTKLVNNLLAGVNLVGAAEVLALAQRMGLDLPTTLGVIEQSSGQSWIGSDRMHRALANGGAGDWAPRAHMGLLAKDTGLAIEAATASGYAAALGQQAADVFQRALAHGLAAEDDAAVFKLMQAEGGSQAKTP